jgi:hypothetical protein
MVAWTASNRATGKETEAAVSGKKQIQVLIATPTFRGSVASTTMSCILKVGMLFASIGVAYRFSYVDSAEIVLVRNYFGSCVMEDPAITHLLFIDDDMSFSEEAVLELLRADKMIIGCTSPRRTIDLEKLHQLGARGVPYPAALSQSLSWVTRHAKPDAVEIRDGNCLVNGQGRGSPVRRSLILRSLDPRLRRRGLGECDPADRTHWPDGVSRQLLGLSPVDADRLRLQAAFPLPTGLN